MLQVARRPSRPACALLPGLAALLLAACDPSPAYRALTAQDRSGEPAAAGPPAVGPEMAAAAAPAPGEPAGPDRATLPAPSLATPAGEEVPAANAPQAATAGASPDDAGSLRLLGAIVAPGDSARLTWAPSEVFEGISTATPVLVVNGARPGPVLCLTAAIHGDELNGIEMVRRVLHELKPEKLRGAVIGVPIVNLQGFRRGSRYLPDRRDLNRYFPGNPSGSSAARIAYSLFEDIVRHCDMLVDLHTGSFYRTNLPQLRADLRDRRVRELAEGFGGMVVLHHEGATGTLRRAAVDAGIPAVTLEAGEPLRLQPAKVSEGVKGIFALMTAKNMIRRLRLLGQPEPVYYESTWIRADHGGILSGLVRLGQLVEPGDVLGTVTDPITNEQNLIYATRRGRVLGMAVNQVVMPGFAAFRIGIETDAPLAEFLPGAASASESGDDALVPEENGESDATPLSDPEETS